MYENTFRDLAEDAFGIPVRCAADQRIKVNLNVQFNSMRYEAHVDTNPIEAILYITTHPVGDGGELIVANDIWARSVEEIDRSFACIYPIRGHLVMFDARTRPHYVRQLRTNGIRVVAAMNYYTASCPESDRPKDLNVHLFGDP